MAFTVSMVSLRAQFHQPVVHRTYILILADGDTLLLYDITGVDFMFEEECGDSGFFLSVDYRPVDRCRLHGISAAMMRGG